MEIPSRKSLLLATTCRDNRDQDGDDAQPQYDLYVPTKQVTSRVAMRVVDTGLKALREVQSAI